MQFDEEIKNLKQDKIVAAYGSDKTQSSGLATASNTNVFVKLDKKDSDGRFLSQLWVHQGHPPERIAALSCDSSFKTINMEIMKPLHPPSSGTCAINDSSKAALSPTG
ncbi:hypothetical protein Acr_26g0004260 [Actinidia rufa]|uniref:Uncharacterized protein n=1 Tax=Actinidia rufa TaxID=165716 RepID=A0A7J0H251_9ERIC|nr:hypothetical protein Acr_26g0004260 [Actinidia rufa]